MRTLLLFSLVLFACCKGQNRWTNGGSAAFRNAVTYVPVIVVTGQSNAGSHGENLSSLYTAITSNVSYWDSTNKVFTPYVANNALENGFGIQTAGLQATLRGGPVYFIRVSQGSLAISNWASPNGSMWKQLDSAILQGARKIRAAGYEPLFLSTIWLQGEQDCVIGTSQSAYQTALSNFIDNYRAMDTRLAGSQFVIVKLREDSGEPTYQPGSVAAINAAYVSVAGSKSNVVLIRPEDVSAVYNSPTDIHYTNASYILIANAWSGAIPN